MRFLGALLLLLALLPSPSSAQSPVNQQCVASAAAQGTSDAITIPALPCALTTNLLILSTTSANTTTTPTLQPLGLTAQTIVLSGGGPLVPGDLTPGGRALLNPTGTQWILLNPFISQTTLNTYSLASFGAKCDGITDDTAAIQAWFSAAAANVALLAPAGNCLFSSALTVPAASNFSILGSGDGATTFTYTGASATVDPVIQIGAENGTAGCSIKGVVISQIRLLSTTAMTAGDALRISDSCDTILDNLTVGGSLNGNRNWYNALRLDGGNTVNVANFSLSGSGAALTINGEPSLAHQFTDAFLAHGTLVNSLIGLHIAGNVGGLNIDLTDDLENGTNILQDQSLAAKANSQLFFGPGFWSDATNPSLYPSAPQIGYHMADKGGPQTAITYKGSLASATNQCFVLDSLAAPSSGVPRVDLIGAWVGNCHSPGGSTTNGGAVDNQNIYYKVTISGGTRFFTSQNAPIPTVYNVSGAQTLNLVGIRADDNFTIGGVGIGGTYILDDGIFHWADPRASANYSMLFDGSGDTGGFGAKMVGNGVTTPSKTMRVFNGNWQIVDDAYTNTLLSVADDGSLTVRGPVQSAQAYSAAGTPIPSCAIGTRGSFATVSDATSATGNYTSGGGTTTWEWCNGTVWTH